MSADALAQAYEALDQAAATITPGTVSRVSEEHGRTTWAVGDVRVSLPTLLPDAPIDAVGRYWIRIVADATGRCPLCDAVADVTVSPDHRVAWELLPVTIAVPHSPGCPALFADSEAAWFASEAWR